jgi:hypothetical protein
MATKADALLSLAPTAEWVLTGDTIRWDSPGIPQPTDAEVDAEVARLTAEAPWSLLRAERNSRLEATDKWALQDTPAMTAEKTAYRQALRDLPANTSDPASPSWPDLP